MLGLRGWDNALQVQTSRNIEEVNFCLQLWCFLARELQTLSFFALSGLVLWQHESSNCLPNCLSLFFFFAVFNNFQHSFSRAEETSKWFFQLVWRLSTWEKRKTTPVSCCNKTGICCDVKMNRLKKLHRLLCTNLLLSAFCRNCWRGTVYLHPESLTSLKFCPWSCKMVEFSPLPSGNSFFLLSCCFCPPSVLKLS